MGQWTETATSIRMVALPRRQCQANGAAGNEY